ncbi:hypothetical protein CMUS01_04180 [Colletotrichum musicola]|uniref:Ankyrin repeat protein n=1 Tax=Colletotrichum musicola TaxID=2175873 RepID=A0A8H6NNK8_9PEZI|nr:hypothetical protein CMUS01_04180 [Colletotrichum musicola]
MKPIYQLSSSIAPILSSASQASPVPAVLVPGGITCVLSLTIRVEDFETKVIETLEWMCDEMDLMKEYKHGNRLRADPAVKAYEVKLATDILRFCVRVDKLYYRGGVKTRGSIRFVFKTIYKSFEDRFGDVKTDFQRHLSALEKRRELVNHRILKEMDTKVSDMGNQLRESGDKEHLRERETRNRKEESAGVTKVLIFSRPHYKEISGAFFNSPNIHVDSDANNADMTEFISIEVERINNDPSPEERTDLEEVKKLMLNNAGGNFLWVYFKMKSITDIGCVEDIKNSLQDTTEDLDELYGKEIKKILEHNNPNVRERAQKALLWVTNSFRPLSKDELYEALAVKPGRKRLNKSQRLLRNVSLSTECTDLISEVNGLHQLRHASLKDFLSSELPMPMQYGALQRQAHAVLAETCLRYLNFQHFGSIHVGSSEELSQLKSQYPLLEYAATYWGRHFSEGRGSKNKPLGSLLVEFLDSKLSMKVSLLVSGTPSTIYYQEGQSGGPTPLHLLSIFNLFNVADHMPKVKSFLESKDDLDRTPIECSVLYERREMTRWLLDHYLEQHRSGTGFDQGILPLHNAAARGHMDILPLSINYCKAEEPDVNGLTPLHYAATFDHDDFIKEMVQLYPGLDVKCRNNNGFTPLHSAALNGASSAVKALVEIDPSTMILKEKQSRIPLHLAYWYGHLHCATVLSNPETINAQDDFGATPLRIACRSGYKALVQYLLEQGADINQLDNNGITTMATALENEHLAIATLLLDRGADSRISTRNGTNIFHLTAQYGDKRMLEKVVKLTSSTKQKVESARALLAQGADPTLKDNYGICGLDYIARDAKLTAEFGYLVKPHVTVDSSSLKSSYARVVVDLSRSIIRARTIEMEKNGVSNRFEEVELYEVLKRLSVLTGDSFQKIQIYGVDFTNHHPLGRYCDICRSDVIAPWFSCTSCVDLDLCPTCHDGYITSEPPRTIRKSVTALWKLEDGVYPILRAAEIFRKRGANFLPIAFRLLGRHAVTWIDSRSAGYTRWRYMWSKDATKWDLNKIPGWRFVRLLEKLRNLDWPDGAESDILEAGQKSTAINIYDELVEIFIRFSPCFHQRFDDKDHLKAELFHELIKEYGDHGLPPLEDVCETTELSTWDPSNVAEKPKVEATDDEKYRSEKLETIRTELLEAASAPSVKKTESENAEGQEAAEAIDPEIDVFEVAWKLAHAMLGAQYTQPLVREG